MARFFSAPGDGGLKGLPLDTGADVLVLVEPALATFERQAALAVERAAIVS